MRPFQFIQTQHWTFVLSGSVIYCQCFALNLSGICIFMKNLLPLNPYSSSPNAIVCRTRLLFGIEKVTGVEMTMYCKLCSRVSSYGSAKDTWLLTNKLTPKAPADRGDRFLSVLSSTIGSVCDFPLTQKKKHKSKNILSPV